MKGSGEILRAHYARLLRQTAAWAGMVVIMLTAMIIPTAAQAAQLTSRKAVLSDSGAGDTSVSIDMFDNIASGATTIKAIRYQFCTSPLYNTTCTLPTGLVRGTTITTQLYNSGAITNAFTAATSGTTDVLLTNATGTSMASPNTLEIKLSGFTNPTTANQEFYIRVITCNTTTCTMGGGDNIDNGAMAVSTSQILSVTANVQEDLTFCVGTSGTTCGNITGSTVTLSPNPMTTGAPSKGSAVMAASTNATSGYTITYNATTFTDTTSDTITAASSSGVALGAGGTEQFGFNLAANSGGNFGSFGAGPSGGSGTVTSPYGTNNQIAYNTAGATQVASATGPTALTLFTMSFGANVGITTKPGAYTATQTFIATGTF